MFICLYFLVFHSHDRTNLYKYLLLNNFAYYIYLNINNYYIEGLKKILVNTNYSSKRPKYKIAFNMDYRERGSHAWNSNGEIRGRNIVENHSKIVNSMEM